MRCILERARTKRQVHAGAADSGRLSAVHVGDPALGKIFRAEAAGSNAPSQPPRANCSRHSRVVRCHRVHNGGVKSCRCSNYNRRRRDCERSCAERFAGTHHYHRKQSLPSGDFESRRSGQELEAQEISRRCQTAPRAGCGARRSFAAKRRLAVRRDPGR